MVEALALMSQCMPWLIAVCVGLSYAAVANGAKEIAIEDTRITTRRIAILDALIFIFLFFSLCYLEGDIMS